MFSVPRGPYEPGFRSLNLQTSGMTVYVWAKAVIIMYRHKRTIETNCL